MQCNTSYDNLWA